MHGGHGGDMGGPQEPSPRTSLKSKKAQKKRAANHSLTQYSD
jgi:hypothetical protein